MLTSSDLAFSEVSNWFTEGGDEILGISFTLHSYKYHHRGVPGHRRMHTSRDVDVAINNGAKVGFTSNSHDFIYAV